MKWHSIITKPKKTIECVIETTIGERYIAIYDNDLKKFFIKDRTIIDYKKSSPISDTVIARWCCLDDDSVLSP